MATYIGSESADDAIYVNALYDQMYGLGGNDTLATNFVGTAAIFGGAGDDHVYFLESVGGFIYGGLGNDFVAGGGYQDALFGEDGNDLMGGGPSQLTYNSSGFYELRPVLIVVIAGIPSAFELASGNDYMYGGQDTDGIYGFEGNDTLFGGSGDDMGIGTGIVDNSLSTDPLLFQAGLFGGAGIDYLDGGAGSDYLNGGTGNDTLLGGSGNDVYFGEDGDDIIYDVSGIYDVNGGQDLMFGGAGNDYLYGTYALASDGRVFAFGGEGNDTIVGGAGIDDLRGDDGNDLLWGGDGTDFVDGGSGNDNLVGNGGSDYFFGSTGADYYNLYFDVKDGDEDQLLFLTAGEDWIVLPASANGIVTYSTFSFIVYGLIPLAGGGNYVFSAENITLAQLQASVVFY